MDKVNPPAGESGETKPQRDQSRLCWIAAWTDVLHFAPDG